MATRNKVWMDSGAFTAFTKGEKIDLPKFCSWLRANEQHIDHYAVLDVIGGGAEGAAGTYAAQKAMEQLGTKPVPCFHYGEPLEFLERYIAEGYEYIALGGMVPIDKALLKDWLDQIWATHLTNEEGEPVVRVHGFGLTTFNLMRRYPWYSVDSSSWLRPGAYGGLFVYEGGQFFNVPVSDGSPKTGEAGAHFNTMPPAARAAVERMVTARGFTIERLATDYKARWMLGARTYLEFAADTKPQPFRITEGGLFGAPTTIWDAAVPVDGWPWPQLELYLAGVTNAPEMDSYLDEYNGLGAHRMYSYHYINQQDFPRKGRK